MNIEFIEKYVKLSDMKAGDIATSKDRNSFFVCGYHYDNLKQQNVKVILDINNLYNQYTDGEDLTQPIKILKSGDQFICKT